jgi:hypothetical protein
MTMALLTPPGSMDTEPDQPVHVGFDSSPDTAVGAGPVRPSLDEALAALFRGDVVECLVCGGSVEVNDGRVECGFCGTLVEPAPVAIAGQLELL